MTKDRQEVSSPLVSVVIPTRGRPQFLRRALESVFNQSYPHIEAVVVDENDPDSQERKQTAEVIERARGQESILYLENRSPTGACQARNDGAAASTGEFLAFLDDDDFWREDKVTRQVELFRSAPSDTGLVYTGLQIVDTQENVIKYRKPNYRGCILNELLAENVINTLSSVMVPRKIFEEVGGFDPAFPSRQDLDLYIRIAERYRIDFVPGPLTCYTNLYNESISKNYVKKLKGRALILSKYQYLYAKRRKIQARYHYGTAKLSLKHGDDLGVLQWLAESLKAYPTVKALVRYLSTLLLHPHAALKKDLHKENKIS